jgi:hypothetical protein
MLTYYSDNGQTLLWEGSIQRPASDYSSHAPVHWQPRVPILALFVGPEVVYV